MGQTRRQVRAPTSQRERAIPSLALHVRDIREVGVCVKCECPMRAHFSRAPGSSYPHTSLWCNRSGQAMGKQNWKLNPRVELTLALRAPPPKKKNSGNNPNKGRRSWTKVNCWLTVPRGRPPCLPKKRATFVSILHKFLRSESCGGPPSTYNANAISEVQLQCIFTNLYKAKCKTKILQPNFWCISRN